MKRRVWATLGMALSVLLLTTGLAPLAHARPVASPPVAAQVADPLGSIVDHVAGVASGAGVALAAVFGLILAAMSASIAAATDPAGIEAAKASAASSAATAIDGAVDGGTAFVALLQDISGILTGSG